MQSNHPCKETVTLFVLLFSVLLSFFSLFLQLTAESATDLRKNHSDNRDRSIRNFSLFFHPFPSLVGSHIGILFFLALSRRFRSIKSASQFQPRVPMPLNLYRFQPITFCWGLRIAVSGHVPIVTRELVFLMRARYCYRLPK